MLCLISCILNCIAYVVGWMVITVVTLKVAFGPAYFQSLRSKAFAYAMEYVIKGELKEVLQQAKIKLFSSLKNLKSAEQELAKKHALNILEVGTYLYLLIFITDIISGNLRNVKCNSM